VAPPHGAFGGAALVSPEGHLLGIGSIFTNLHVPGFGAVPANMFVPVELLKPILEQLQSMGRALGPRKPWLGINAHESAGRVFITRVSPGGPADTAGLRAGDIILTVAGEDVENLADFYHKVWALGPAGVTVPLTVLQGSRVLEAEIQSGDRYRNLKLGTSPTEAILRRR
jgi:S1-C subfamily serine protease